MYNKGPLYEVLDASEWFSFEEGLRCVVTFRNGTLSEALVFLSGLTQTKVSEA